MNSTTVAGHRDRIPFRPFRINLSNGRVFQIEYPDHVMVPRNANVVILFANGITHTIDSRQIVEIEELTPQTNPS